METENFKLVHHLKRGEADGEGEAEEEYDGDKSLALSWRFGLDGIAATLQTCRGERSDDDEDNGEDGTSNEKLSATSYSIGEERAQYRSSEEYGRLDSWSLCQLITDKAFSLDVGYLEIVKRSEYP